MNNAFPVHPHPTRIAGHLDGLRRLPTSERISAAFLAENGFESGDASDFISLARSLEMLKRDGSPGPLFERIRTSEQLPPELAWAVVNAYDALFQKAPGLARYQDQKVATLVAQLLDVPDSSQVVTDVVATFRALVEVTGVKAIDRAVKRQRRGVKTMGFLPIAAKITGLAASLMLLGIIFELIFGQPLDQETFRDAIIGGYTAAFCVVMMFSQVGDTLLQDLKTSAVLSSGIVVMSVVFAWELSIFALLSVHFGVWYATLIRRI